jgi:phospholipid/cholesterol/gamma-HCH transport system ATP-binding protein
MAQPDEPADGREPVLEMIDVTVATEEESALPWIQGINWTVRRGDYWVVGGLEETGKTELLTTAVGLQRPLRGSVKIFQDDFSALNEAQVRQMRLRVGLIFESGARLFSGLTVGENIALALKYHQTVPYARIENEVREILELTGLTSCLHKMPGRVARSVQQRAGLARALVLRPEVLLLDKPVGGLDPKETRWWLDFLGQLHRGHSYLGGRPVTLVVTTHDLRNWRQAGDHFAVIRNQRWAVLGDRAALEESDEPLLRELLSPDFLTD